MRVENKNVLKFQTDEIIYYLYFAVMTFAKGLGLYDGMWPYTAALCMGAVLLAIKLSLTEHTLAEWCYVLGMTALGILIWKNSDQTGALIYITMIIGMKNIPIRRLFSLSLLIWGTTFVLQTILTLTGLRSDIFVVHEKLGLGFIIRWSLGQPHPNVLQITFLIICALILYLTNLKGKQLVYATVAMLAANLYVFFYSVSYTGLILVVFYLVANLYLAFRNRLCSAEKMIGYLVFPACAAFAVLGPVVFKGRLWEICNKVLNTRFNIAKNHLTVDPITLFGSRASDAIPAGLHNIDSSYVFALMRYGAVLFALMCMGYMMLIHHCIKQGKHRELSIILGLAVAAIAEPFFVNSSYKNISLLFLGAFIFERFQYMAEKNPNSVWNRKYMLLSVGKKEWQLPETILQSLQERFQKTFSMYWKVILAAGICAGIIAGTVFAVTADMPSEYYALRTSTQVVEEVYLFLDINELPGDFDGKILNYKDAQTPMQMFEGNISKVEFARGIVSSGLWFGLSVSMLLALIIAWKVKEKENTKSGF